MLRITDCTGLSPQCGLRGPAKCAKWFPRGQFPELHYILYIIDSSIVIRPLERFLHHPGGAKTFPEAVVFEGSLCLIHFQNHLGIPHHLGFSATCLTAFGKVFAPPRWCKNLSRGSIIYYIIYNIIHKNKNKGKKKNSNKRETKKNQKKGGFSRANFDLCGKT